MPADPSTPADGRPRPRLLVLNQYYWPGPEATGQLLADLCSGLAADFEVTVVTGTVASPHAPLGSSVHEGVRVVRVASTAYDRSGLARRALNYASYLAAALAAGLRQDRPDVVLSMTDPPMVADVALAVARRFRAPLVVVSQDVFPEAAIALRKVDNPVVVSVLRALVAAYLRRADVVVAIGETMRARLVAKGARPDRVTVIPNWVDTQELSPQPQDNEWARERGVAGSFVVMHSGNLGHAQDLDTLIRAAALLDDGIVLIVGGGSRRGELERLARELGTDRVRFLGYQPRRVLPQSLSAASVHVVGLAAGLAGYVVPSRLYGILAVARPVIAAADEESETVRIVREAGCGVVVRPGRPEALAAAIHDLQGRPAELEAMGARGRAWVEAEADRSVAVGRYRELLLELAGA